MRPQKIIEINGDRYLECPNCHGLFTNKARSFIEVEGWCYGCYWIAQLEQCKASRREVGKKIPVEV